MKEQKRKSPGWAKYWSFDQAAEALPVSEETTRELWTVAEETGALEKGDKVQSEINSGERAYLEIDVPKSEGYALSNIWSKLSSKAQDDIIDSYKRNNR